MVKRFGADHVLSAKAIYLWDEDPDFFEERGKVYLYLKDYKMAISNFKQALRSFLVSECTSTSTSTFMGLQRKKALELKQLQQAVHEQTGRVEATHFQPAGCGGAAGAQGFSLLT